MNILSLEGAAHGVKANALLPIAMSRMSAAMDEKLMQAAAALYGALGDKLGNGIACIAAVSLFAPAAQAGACAAPAERQRLASRRALCH